MMSLHDDEYDLLEILGDEEEEDLDHDLELLSSLKSGCTLSQPLPSKVIQNKAEELLNTPAPIPINFPNVESQSSTHDLEFETFLSSLEEQSNFPPSGIMNDSAHFSWDMLDSTDAYLGVPDSSQNVGSTSADDPSLFVVNSALNANQIYRYQLVSKLQWLDGLLAKNLELQKRVRQLGGFKNNFGVIDPLKKSYLFSSYFATTDASQPFPTNDDVKKRMEREKVFPVNVRWQKWTKEERETLCKAIRFQNQRILMSEAVKDIKRKYGLNALEELSPQSAQAAHVLSDVKESMVRIQMQPNEKLEENLDGIEWQKILDLHFPKKTVRDLQIQWTVNQHPLINKADWSKSEISSLKQIISKYQGRDWVKIAQELGTNRTASQCFSFFQQSLNKSMRKSSWTKEEDELLLKAIDIYGHNWQEVATCLEGRTGQQCLHRFFKTTDPSIKRGKWGKDEDELLRQGVAAHGTKNWRLVQLFVPGRTDVQCRERWLNSVDPNYRKTTWTPEEEKILKEAISMHGPGKWALISSIVKTRTDNQCWRRYKRMIKKSPDAFNNVSASTESEPQVPEDGEEEELSDDESTCINSNGKRPSVAESQQKKKQLFVTLNLNRTN